MTTYCTIQYNTLYWYSRGESQFLRKCTSQMYGMTRNALFKGTVSRQILILLTQHTSFCSVSLYIQMFFQCCELLPLSLSGPIVYKPFVHLKGSVVDKVACKMRLLLQNVLYSALEDKATDGNAVWHDLQVPRFHYHGD